jgi:hypothetical protein
MRRKAEEKLLAELFLSLKGRKRKPNDWITIAKKCQALIDEYGSYQLTAQKLGVSYEVIRAIASMLKLPPQVQDLVSRGRILFDAAQRLNGIRGAENQIRVANVIAGLPSHDARQIIQYAKKFPDADLVEYKERVASSKTQTERIDVLVLPLRRELFRTLQQIGARRGMSVQRLVQDIVSGYVAKEDSGRQ